MSARKSNSTVIETPSTGVELPGISADVSAEPVIGPVTEAEHLAALLSDAGGWESESERVRRDWDKLADGTIHSETFSDKKAASAFKGQLKTRAKKVGKSIKVRTLDKDSSSPMVIFQFTDK